MLLSINRDRPDAHNLPESKLDLCQVEPLTLDMEGEWSGPAGVGDGEGVVVWKKDELEPRVFVAYAGLTKVKGRDNGKADRWRRWVLEEPLTEGCRPPSGADEELAIL